MEDVIDMSSDNLSRLSQEADMVEVDAVIRYIRELSELSGRLRYADAEADSHRNRPDPALPAPDGDLIRSPCWTGSARWSSA